MRRVLRSLSNAAFVIVMQAAAPVALGQISAPAADDARIKAGIQTIKSGQAADRNAAANYLIENWQKSLPLLVAEVGAIDRGITKTAPSDQDLTNLFPVTDALRGIFVNKDGSIQAFRTMSGKDKAVRALIWAARSENKALRVNSTYSLANVADNTTICYVLDHLQDKNLSPHGRINLLQVALPVASYAYSENFTATKLTIEAVNKMMAESKDNFEQTTKLIGDLDARLEMSINKSSALPTALSACKDFKPVFGKLN